MQNETSKYSLSYWHKTCFHQAVTWCLTVYPTESNVPSTADALNYRPTAFAWSQVYSQQITQLVLSSRFFYKLFSANTCNRTIERHCWCAFGVLPFSRTSAEWTVFSSRLSGTFRDMPNVCVTCSTFRWSVPWLSTLAIIVLVIVTAVLYFVPIRYVILVWGINKFTKKLRSPNAIDNNEILDYLSRVPSDKELVGGSSSLSVRAAASCGRIAVMSDFLFFSPTHLLSWIPVRGLRGLSICYDQPCRHSYMRCLRLTFHDYCGGVYRVLSPGNFAKAMSHTEIRLTRLISLANYT